MSRRRALLPALAMLVAGPAGAETAEAATALPPAQVLVTYDRALATPGGRAARPLSLWSDPAAAAAWTHASNQLALLAGGRVPANRVLDGLDGGALTILPAASTDPDPRRARFTFLLRHGSAGELAQAFAAHIDQAAPSSIGPFAGVGNGGFFAGSGGGMLALGDPAALAGVGGAVPPGEPAAISASLDLGPTIALVKRLETIGVSYHLDPLLPRWRDEPAQLAVRLSPQGDSWAGSVRLTAAALPLRAADASVTSLMRSGRHVRACLGVDPQAVAQLVVNLAGVAAERDAEAALGMRVLEAAECFTGDVLLLIDGSGIVPQGCLALRVREATRFAAVAANLAARWDGVPIEAPGADAAWALDTPIGPIGLAYNTRYLVIGNDPDLAPQLLAGTPGDAAAPAGVAALVEIDLPQLAKQWLPLGWRLLGDRRLELGADVLGVLRFRLPDAALALHQSLGEAARWSTLVAPQPPALTLRRNAGAPLPWAPPHDLAAQLRVLVPEGDLGAGLDRAVSAWVDAGGETSATVIRLADGFHVLEDDRRGRSVALNPAQLATRLAGLRLAVGPAVAQLVEVAVPPRPALDRRWLPEPAVVQRHLAPYRLEVRVDETGATGEERGVPLGSFACVAAMVKLGLLDQPRMLRYHQRFSGDSAPAPEPAPAPGPGPGKVEL